MVRVKSSTIYIQYIGTSNSLENFSQPHIKETREI
jgi:hypothetical protein